MTTWLALGLQTLSLLGAIAGIYAKISGRLTTIEVQLTERDRTSAQREELYERRNRDAFEEWCRTSCPRSGPGGTNPRIQLYSGPIAPDGGQP